MGFEDEIGEHNGYGFNRNFIFSKQVKADEYIDILKHAISIISDFDPSIVIIPFGGDTFKSDKDPSTLYGCRLELEDYIDIGKNYNLSIEN